MVWLSVLMSQTGDMMESVMFGSATCRACLNGTWRRLWSAMVSHRGTAVLWRNVLHDVEFGWYGQPLHVPILWINAVSAGYLASAHLYVLPPLVKKDRRQSDWVATLSYWHAGVIKSSAQQLLHFLIININNAPVNRSLVWWNVSVQASLERFQGCCYYVSNP